MRSVRTTHLQRCVDRLREGDDRARGELIEGACDRLRVLAHRMLRSDRVRRWEQTDDVLQHSLIRLHDSLSRIQPSTVREFMRLAALHIRRTLVSLARHYFGPRGVGANHASNGETKNGLVLLDTPAREPLPGQALDKADLWLELHAAIEQLPDDEREVVELIWLYELTQVEAAEILSVNERTIARRWVRARLKLHGMLSEDFLD